MISLILTKKITRAAIYKLIAFAVVQLSVYFKICKNLRRKLLAHLQGR